MMTGCFHSYNGEDGIAICISSPASWKGQNYRQLNPPMKTFYDIKRGRIDQEEYSMQFKKLVLDNLDPHKVLDELKDKVMLCWERPIFDESGRIINSGKGFCHRHLVSKWITENTGYEVVEWTLPKMIEKSIKLF